MMTTVGNRAQQALEEQTRESDELYDACADWMKKADQKAALAARIRELDVEAARDKVVALIEFEPDEFGDFRITPKTERPEGPPSFLINSKMTESGDVEFERKAKRATRLKKQGDGD